VNSPCSTQLVEHLRSAKWVAAFTGAGISAESGVPTFRSPDGLWSKFKPEELASMEGFLNNPSMVWEWYKHRKKIIAEVKPNAGHFALVALEKLVPRVSVITQNIDNLHRRAGSTAVHELHGNIERNYCMKCGARKTEEELALAGDTPRCAACGGLIRPDVVWFGEMLPDDEWEHAVRAARGADVFFSIGTSAVVYPAASLPLVALDAGAYVVEINPEPTPLTPRVQEFLQAPSGTILPEILSLLQKTTS
jgi:NAD-dependent deacetylase